MVQAKECSSVAGSSEKALAPLSMKGREWREQGHIELLRDVSERRRERAKGDMEERFRARVAARESSLASLVQTVADKVVSGGSRSQSLLKSSITRTPNAQDANKITTSRLIDDRQGARKGVAMTQATRSASLAGNLVGNRSIRTLSAARRAGSLSANRQPSISSDKAMISGKTCDECNQAMLDRVQLSMPLPGVALDGKESSTSSGPSTASSVREKELCDEATARAEADVVSPRSVPQGTENCLGTLVGILNDSRFSSVSDFKRTNENASEKRVFACPAAYPDLKTELLKRGWIENKDLQSRVFDLKFTKCGDIDFETLRPEQQVNHFWRSWELTTKVGLTMSMRNAHWHGTMKGDAFYPRAFNLYDVNERADFVCDFRLTKAEAIMHGFISHFDTKATWTFSEDVLRTAVNICRRSLWDWDDLIDNDGTGPLIISDTDWELLKYVNLDDVRKPLDDSANQNLDEVVMKKKRASIVVRTNKEQEKIGPSAEEAAQTSIEADHISVPAEHYATARGQHLRKETQFVLQQMAKNQYPQVSCNGDRNAWIVKPAGKSRGRGIQVCRELHEVFHLTHQDDCQWIAQKYIERPQLIHGYKFDIRQWVVVTDWNPLTVWIWKQPYLRFAGKKYDPTITDKDQYVHLVNNSIVKHMDGFHEPNEDLDTSGYMWFRQQYEDWLHTRYCSCEEHHTPFLTPPPYTCETYGVRWEDVKFTEADSDDEDGSDEMRPSPPEISEVKLEGKQEPAEITSSGDPKPSCRDTVAPASVLLNNTACVPCGDSRSCPCKETTNDEGGASPRAKVAFPFEESHKTNSKATKPCQDIWEDCIRPQMNDIILSSLFCAAEGISQRKNSHELYGYDFMITEDDRPGKQGLPRVWLIEVNSSPAMDYSTPVTTPLVKKVMEDVLKVILDVPGDPEADTGEFERIRHPAENQCATTRPRNHEKLEVVGAAIEVPQWMKSKRRRERKQTKGPTSEAD